MLPVTFFTRGDYETFLRVRADVVKNQIKEYNANQEAREHIQKFINKFRFNAKRATLVQSRIKALDRLPVIELPEEDPPVILTIPPAAPISNNVSPHVLGFLRLLTLFYALFWLLLVARW